MKKITLKLINNERQSALVKMTAAACCDTICPSDACSPSDPTSHDTHSTCSSTTYDVCGGAPSDYCSDACPYPDNCQLEDACSKDANS
jgi:hypothetical protein